MDIKETTQMTSNPQANLPPHNRKRQPHLARTNQTQTTLEKRPTRKGTKNLKLRKPGTTSSRKAWKTRRKKERPRNSRRRKTGKLRKMMRRWRTSVLWRRCRRRGPEGSQDSSSKKKIMTRSKKRRTRERKRARKMKRGERKRSRRRPKRREKKSRRMRNRRKSRR